MEGLQRKQEKPKFEVLKTIGGSDANKLVHGTFRVWSDLVYDKILGESKDLSNILPVQMGIETEDFNRRWFEKITGFDVEIAEDPLTNAKYDFAHARVDGLIHSENLAVFEAKHTNPFKSLELQVEKYYGQLQHYMMVTEADSCYLSIFSGNMNHSIYEVSKDNRYIDLLKYAEIYLYQCIMGFEELSEEVYDKYQEYKKEKLNEKN